MMADQFPEDNYCHEASLGAFHVPCREPVEYTLIVEGGGFVAKLCADHFDALSQRWSVNAREAARRYEPAEEPAP